MTGGRGRRRDWGADVLLAACLWVERNPVDGGNLSMGRAQRCSDSLSVLGFERARASAIKGGSCSLAGAAGGGHVKHAATLGSAETRGHVLGHARRVRYGGRRRPGAWEFATGGARPGGRARLNSILSACSPRREARVRCAHRLGPRPRPWGRDRKVRVPGRPRAALVCRRLRPGSRLLEPLRRSGERRDLLRARRRPALGLSGGRSCCAMTTVEKAPRPALLFPDPGR
jgi:hypothetical protein